MTKRRRRKFFNCGQIFRPDPRNVRQRYCSAPACRKASKAASQARWLSNPRLRTTSAAPSMWPGYGPGGAANPGYARLGRPALQEDIARSTRHF